MKARNNDKVSKTLKLCKALFQKKNNYNKHQDKKKKLLYGQNYNIDSCSYGDQTESESDDWERFSDFVDSELIFDSSNDDWIPKVVIITRI